MKPTGAATTSDTLTYLNANSILYCVRLRRINNKTSSRFFFYSSKGN